MAISACRVLIVDSDRLFARDIEQYLAALGHEVVQTVKSVDEAVTSATLHRPDFIIMVLEMAGQSDGIEAAREIFANLGIRCVFAAENVDRSVWTKSADAKPLGWLSKPYSSENFLLVLSTALLRLGKA